MIIQEIGSAPALQFILSNDSEYDECKTALLVIS